MQFYSICKHNNHIVLHWLVKLGPLNLFQYHMISFIDVICSTSRTTGSRHTLHNSSIWIVHSTLVSLFIFEEKTLLSTNRLHNCRHKFTLPSHMHQNKFSVLRLFFWNNIYIVYRTPTLFRKSRCGLKYKALSCIVHALV